MISRFVPYSFKVIIRQQQRKLRDIKNGHSQSFAKKIDKIKAENFIEVAALQQPIHYNPLAANKVANIKIAQAKIEHLLIHPGEIFSFWELVKKPSAKYGYKTGRNIIGDSLQEDIGGGLCQISGIIYHLALVGGLEILERHNHTIDLYTEENRYTPIGTDATVVFGFKDIRFKNNTNSVLSLKFNVTDTVFSASLLANHPIPLYNLRFERLDNKPYREVKTYRALQQGESVQNYNFSQEEFVNLSRYKL